MPFIKALSFYLHMHKACPAGPYMGWPVNPS